MKDPTDEPSGDYIEEGVDAFLNEAWAGHGMVQEWVLGVRYINADGKDCFLLADGGSSTYLGQVGLTDALSIQAAANLEDIVLRRDEE